MWKYLFWGAQKKPPSNWLSKADPLKLSYEIFLYDVIQGNGQRRKTGGHQTIPISSPPPHYGKRDPRDKNLLFYLETVGC